MGDSGPSSYDFGAVGTPDISHKQHTRPPFEHGVLGVVSVAVPWGFGLTVGRYGEVAVDMEGVEFGDGIISGLTPIFSGGGYAR